MWQVAGIVMKKQIALNCETYNITLEIPNELIESQQERARR